MLLASESDLGLLDLKVKMICRVEISFIFVFYESTDSLSFGASGLVMRTKETSKIALQNVTTKNTLWYLAKIPR